MIGKSFNMIFISQVGMGVLAFVCSSHPNGKPTVFGYPSTIGFEGEHNIMALLGGTPVSSALAFFGYFLNETYPGSYVLTSPDALAYRELGLGGPVPVREAYDKFRLLCSRSFS